MMYGKLCTEFYDADKKFSSLQEVNFYKTLLNKNDLILEPMCGSGRLLIPLLQEGFTVHGLDNSASMLDSCKERAYILGQQPTLFYGEIENISLQHRYNKIVIPFGSFQLLHPRLSALQALDKLKMHLSSDGKLILHLFIPWEWLYENAQNQSSERQVTTKDGGIIKIVSHGNVNKQEQYSLVNSVYHKILNDRTISEENEQLYICWYYRYEMELMLEKCGFKNIIYMEQYFNNENHMFYIAET